MARRLPARPVQVLEFIVSRPPLATITVGGSILLLLWAIDAFAGRMPELRYLRLLVPFIPPFFITRTAKRINMRKAEFNFIADAEPVIYVGYAASPTLDSLLAARPEAVSDSTSRHLLLPAESLLQTVILPDERFHADERRRIFSTLLAAAPESDGRRVVGDYRIVASMPRSPEDKEFLMTAVLKTDGSRWKLQMILMPLPCAAPPG